VYLKSFSIKNFRAIKHLDLTLQKGVNVFIGENNAGKSAIIDALRICLSYGSAWRNISVDLSDFHIDKTDCAIPLPAIEFHLYFAITKPDKEPGWFNDMHAVDENGKEDIQLHFRFYVETVHGNDKIRRRMWGGAKEGQNVSSDTLDLFYFVYLEPLRDAVQSLRPVRGSKIGQLFLNIIKDDDHRKHLSGKVKSSLNGDSDWKKVVDDGKSMINTHLFATSIKGKEQDVNLDFLPFEFKRIVENLFMQMPVFKTEVLNGDDKNQKYFDLNQNGLGYNNLIYTATVLGHLKQKAIADPEAYMALLIEEPEAHLHPQLQNIFFKYLLELNNEQFQIFVTSHSPTITAKANLETLHIIQTHNNVVSYLPIVDSSLGPTNRTYLQKFLDVTKSQLFFANGVLLVEGISEALLLPAFARIMGEEYQLDKAGIEIVNINGVAFEHFAKLFNNDNEKKRLQARCAIITDDDRNEDGIEDTARAQNALDLKGGALKVSLGNVTFEYELFIAGSNKDILLEIFKTIKPKAAANINAGSSLAEFGIDFVSKVKKNKAKSELAHRLAIALDGSAELRAKFTVPKYIQDAVIWVVEGK
jgi:putative ATP-dependent endonuclease of OLD family